MNTMNQGKVKELRQEVIIAGPWNLSWVKRDEGEKQ